MKRILIIAAAIFAISSTNAAAAGGDMDPVDAAENYAIVLISAANCGVPLPPDASDVLDQLAKFTTAKQIQDTLPKYREMHRQATTRFCSFAKENLKRLIFGAAAGSYGSITETAAGWVATSIVYDARCEKLSNYVLEFYRQFAFNTKQIKDRFILVSKVHRDDPAAWCAYTKDHINLIPKIEAGK
jgi:hypothetical protein